jgi:hypothetical protein
LNRGILIVLCVVFGLFGCDRKSPGHKEYQILNKAKTVGVKNADLMTGISDEFNPGNNIESRRKTNLTSFGRLKKHIQVATPNKDIAEKVINKKGFDKLMVTRLIQTPITIPSYPFDYENKVEALKKLSNQHNLKAIIKEDMSELDKLMALMVYVYDFFEGGTPLPPEMRWTAGPSAETITQLRRKDGIGGTSEQYAALFCQLSLSCGFTSRIISMHTLDEDDEILTHNVCEVYLDSYEKWVAFDPFTKATYYLRDEKPLSALDLRLLMLSNMYRSIMPVSGRSEMTDVVSVREKILPRYRYIYMWRMNDILGRSTKGKSIPWQALYQTHLVWEDASSLIAQGGFEKLDKFTNTDNPSYPLTGVKYVTHTVSDFYWMINNVTITVERSENNTLLAYFDTFTPNFDHFTIIMDQNNTKPIYLKENIFAIRNLTNMSVTSVNMFGRSGPLSLLGIDEK